MRILSLVAIIVVLCGLSFGQQAYVIQVAGTPSTCAPTRVYNDTTNNKLYIGTTSSTCVLVGGSGSVTGSGTTNTVTKFTGTNAVGNSSVTDDGTNVTATEPYLAPDGLVSAPAYSFTNNTGFGLWRNANNDIRFAILGNQSVFSINSSNGGFQFLSGNYPTWSSGSTIAGCDTGLSRTGAATLALGTCTTGNATGTLQATNWQGAANSAIVVQGGQDVNTTGTGGSATIRGQNVVAGGANNLAGGSVVIAAGIGTGTSTPATVKIQSSPLGLAAAATQNALVTRYVTHVKAGSTTSAQATSMLNIASAANTTWGLKLLVHVQLISSTPNVCGTTEEFSLTGTNNNGAFGTVNVVAGTLSTLCSTGTLTLAVSATAANPSVISVTPTWGTITSITSATITVEIWNPSQQEISLL